MTTVVPSTINLETENLSTTSHDILKRYSDRMLPLFLRGKIPAEEESSNPEEWADYITIFGMTREDIPELIQILEDEDIEYHASDEILWAPVYAWRLCGQLKATETIPVLISKLRSDYGGCTDPMCTDLHYDLEDEWINQEIPYVLSMMGKEVLPSLAKTIMEINVPCWFTITIADTLIYIVNTHPVLRKDCIDAINARLSLFAHNNKTLNGFLISRLTDIKAIESLELIRAAYLDKYVDLMVCGDVEDCEIKLGIRKERDTPRPNYLAEHFPNFFEALNRMINKTKLSEKINGNNLTNSPLMTTKAGRNDPCPCNSGKKYKKCCLLTERN